MRFHGKVGYGVSTNRGDGVWTNEITERTYKGTVKKALASKEDGEKVNADVRLQNRISIVADAFAFDHFADMEYVEWAGSLWTVQSVEVERPRLVLSLGGVYNGERPVESPSSP